MEQRFDVLVDEAGGAASIRPDGVLDIRSAADFEHEFLTALGRRPREMVVDLRNVTFLDSIGLRSLFRVTGWAERRQVPLSVIAGSEAVRRLLRITGTDVWLPLVDAPPHGVNGFDRSKPRKQAHAEGGHELRKMG
jgi:anti-anti-sigma factor